MSNHETEDNGRLFPDVGSQSVDNREIRVRFVNRCPFPIDVFWLNQKKEPTKYGTLNQKQYLDIKTYRNHPWVARRSFDGCKVLLNKNTVYWPEPTAHKNIIVRTHCDITPRVQSLREMASRTLLRESPAQIQEKMDTLPRDLQYEMTDLVHEKREYNEIVCRQVPAPRVTEAAPPAPPRQP